MRLNSGWVLGFGQNLQQLVIRQEEEASKEKTLLLQIVVQALLNVFQKVVGLSKLDQHSFLVGGLYNSVVCSLKVGQISLKQL